MNNKCIDFYLMLTLNSYDMFKQNTSGASYNQLMNNIQKTLNKNELLSWLNTQINSDNFSVQKIEELGNGVAYIALLNKLHPGIIDLAKVRIFRKPKMEHENIENLKILVNAMGRLNITKNIDIARVAKMKMQQNLGLLQWFYKYAQNMILKEEACKIQQNRPKNLKIRAPIQLKRVNLRKKDVQGEQILQFKKTAMDLRKIRQIEDVCGEEDDENSTMKLRKIKQILGIGDQNENNMTPLQSQLRNHGNATKEEDTMTKSEINSQEQFKSVSIKNLDLTQSRDLSLMYQSYLKKSQEYFKKEEDKTHKEEIRVSQNLLIDENENGNGNERQQQDERLTDNSILLEIEKQNLNCEKQKDGEMKRHKTFEEEENLLAFQSEQN